MFAKERLAEIERIIESEKRMTSKELSERFNVSESTIRRDLKKLANNYSRIIRTHGGVIYRNPAGHEMSILSRKTQNIEEKKRIANKASTYIKEEEVILIDAGTTTMELARNIGNLNISIITNALNVASYLTEHGDMKIILLGGCINRKNQSLLGPLALNTLESFNVNKLFMSVYGIDAEQGLTEPVIEAAEIKKKMIARSEEIFLLADSSKVGHVLLNNVADFDEIDHLITDKKVDSQFIEEVRKKLVNVNIV